MTRTVVAITGASSGIGEAFARKLAPEHDLLLIARRTERLHLLARDLEDRYGCRSETLTADLTNATDLESAAQAIAREPNLVLLVNNAGFGTRGSFWQTDYSQQEAMHKLHVMAPLRLMRAALDNLVPRDHGAIINVASVAAFFRMPGATSYAATKTWMTTFTEGIYTELRSHKSQVRVQALCPGYTYSEFHDKIQADRNKLAPAGLWHTAESIVDASLAGLQKNKLFVVPGWRYRALTSFLSKIPTWLRVFIEVQASKRPAAKALTGSREQPEMPGTRLTALGVDDSVDD